MRLLDRYVIRNFVQVYFYCIAGFTSIWLIFDVSDNISTFIDEHISVWLVVRYYATQIPQVFIILLPVALLLSLLFALGRMSRANEIVSMLTAGIGLIRVLKMLNDGTDWAGNSIGKPPAIRMPAIMTRRGPKRTRATSTERGASSEAAGWRSWTKGRPRAAVRKRQPATDSAVEGQGRGGVLA